MLVKDGWHAIRLIPPANLETVRFANVYGIRATERDAKMRNPEPRLAECRVIRKLRKGPRNGTTRMERMATADRRTRGPWFVEQKTWDLGEVLEGAYRPIRNDVSVYFRLLPSSATPECDRWPEATRWEDLPPRGGNWASSQRNGWG